MKHSKTTLIALISASLLSTTGCIIHVGAHENNNRHNKHHQVKSHDRVFGGIEVDANQKVDNLTTVNGGIEVADGVEAKKVETVNGGIELGKHVKIMRGHTVNGGIEAGPHLQVKNDLSTVNGGIQISEFSSIGHGVFTVNGDIHINHSKVGGNVKTKTGDIVLKNNSVVEGDLIFELKNKDSWWPGKNSTLPTLRIDESSVVKGRILLDRKVVLEIDNEDLLAKVERRYSNQ